MEWSKIEIDRLCKYTYVRQNKNKIGLYLPSCGTSLHYVPSRTLMVLFDQNNFLLNKTGLHMVDSWSVHPNLTLLTSRVCLVVTVRALSSEHGELLSDWLCVA